MLDYLFSCNVCDIQDVGCTVDRLRLRWNNYKKFQRGDTKLFPSTFFK